MTLFLNFFNIAPLLLIQEYLAPQCLHKYFLQISLSTVHFEVTFWDTIVFISVSILLYYFFQILIVFSQMAEKVVADEKVLARANCLQ